MSNAFQITQSDPLHPTITVGGVDVSDQVHGASISFEPGLAPILHLQTDYRGALSGVERPDDPGGHPGGGVDPGSPDPGARGYGMSTTTGPNTRAGELAMVRIMDDTVDIDRPPTSASLVLDQGTGELLPGSYSSVYSGPALVRGAAGAPSDRGGQLANESNQTLYLPLPWLRDHPGQEPEYGDRVTVTTSRRDPLLVGRQYVVQDVEAGSIVVARKCSIQYRGQRP